MEQEFKIKGLNKPWEAAGFNNVYATLERNGENCFHAAFDETKFTSDRLNALFNYFKNGDDDVWKDNKNLKAIVSSDGLIIDIKNLH